jgi:hypothetical protein
MIPRYPLLCALLLSVAATAATKKAEEKFEYLLPEDWKETQEGDGSAAKPTSLELTPKAFQAGMKKYVKEEEDCRSTSFGPLHPLKEGAVVYQEAKLEGATAQMFLDVASSGKITSAKFEAPQKDAEHLMLMTCTTYALMRTMQPKYATQASAHGDVVHLWTEAQVKPFSKAFFFNTFKAQVIPLQLEVF